MVPTSVTVVDIRLRSPCCCHHDTKRFRTEATYLPTYLASCSNCLCIHLGFRTSMMGFWPLILMVVGLLPGGSTASSTSSSASTPPSTNLATAMWRQGRRWLNFSSLLSSPTAASPYERIAGHPVFAITTPWGSPYMNMERLDDLEEVVRSNNDNPTARKGGSISEEQNEYRTVCLYFLDPDDATAVHGEMKQMDNMQGADLRITSFSLSKALRQAANFGQGLPTGQPPEPTTGALSDSQGALRYKIVPPKRQLYYAARCIGKERVGLWGADAAQDAQTALLGNGALEAENLVRRRTKRERKTVPARTRLQAQNAHMEGYTGIPVFYHPHLQRRVPLVKRLLSGNAREIPLFFNYEDLQTAYQTVRQRSSSKGKSRAASAAMPEQMQNVEVFNLWDVLTSMDRDYYGSPQPWLDRLKARFFLPTTRRLPPGLTDITFVPNSQAARYKESISKRGNGKARLRPMR